MVIDLSKLNYVVVDPHRKRAIVGGGTNFGHLNATLDLYKLHLPGGGCQGVCVGGYMQGGGYGFTSRQFGMHCDNVLEMLVMLHDGRIVRTNDHCNKDLFWAIRGGTGGNFGIVLEIEYQLHDLWQVWGFGLKWPIANGAAALLEMQNAYSKDGASDKLGYMGMVAYQTRDGDPQPKPCVMMRGLYDGSEADGRAAIASLLALPGVELELDRTSSYFELDPWLLSTPTEIPECPDLAREDKQSGIIAKPLALADWQKVLDMFLKTPNPWTTIVTEPYGGAINRRSPTYNAFIHRDGYMDLFMDVFWMNEDERVQAVDYLDAFIAMMSSYYNGHEYQNYPRATQKNYRWAYWGTSYNTLLAIKQKYDPHDFFRYQQSIKPYPAFYGGADDSDITVDTSSLLFPIDDPIQYEPYAAAP
jgi:FAD/FMN-containing dehydrogenase